MVEYKENVEIPLKDLRRLYKSVRWLHYMRPKLLKTAYERSDYVISAWDGRRLIGVARAISDGVFNAYISDILVEPKYRRIGIAKELVNRVLKYYRGLYNITAVAEDKRGEKFLEKCGFTQRRISFRRMRQIKNVIMLTEERWHPHQVL